MSMITLIKKFIGSLTFIWWGFFLSLVLLLWLVLGTLY